MSLKWNSLTVINSCIVYIYTLQKKIAVIISAYKKENQDV